MAGPPCVVVGLVLNVNAWMLYVRTLDNAKICTTLSAVIGFRGWGSQKGAPIMVKNTRQTSPTVASKASKILSDPKSTKAEKSTAASALAQTKKKGS